jgi:DNA end-binding protein Ku
LQRLFRQLVVGGDMARVIWQGAISFSLIHIPVALHSASRSNALDLDLLDRRDFSPVGYQRINKKTGKDVEWENIVKGYQHRPGEYVALTEEDFRLANVEATRTIDIAAFVDPGEIAPSYYETPYYLSAGKGGSKVYALFRDVLTQAKVVAIGTVVIRTRQYVCALSPLGGTLVLNTLRYADEVLSPEEFADVPKGKIAKISRQELEMAMQLVARMKQPWKPQAFHDSYRDDLMKRIEQKVRAGETHELTPTSKTSAEPATAKVVDLTALLRKSLEASTQRGAATHEKKTAPGQRARSRVVRRRSVRTQRSRA